MSALAKPGALDSIVRDMWFEPILRNMPDGTTFEHGVDEVQVWARLSSRRRTTTAQMAISDLARLEGRSMVARLDSLLEGLRREHHWPVRVDAALDADPSWVGG